MLRSAAAALAVVAATCAIASAQPVAPHGGDASLQVVAGYERYRAICGRCHGHDLRTKYGEVPSLIGYAFDTHWRGRTVAELYERIRVTMPAMGPLLDAQLSVDLTAYILWMNGILPEPGPLPPDPAVLGALAIPHKD
jgi:mono/diheme cytochrome c family protein